MNQVEIHRIPNKWGKQAAWDSLQVSFAFQSDRQNGDNNWNNKNRIPKDWSLREVGVTGIILNLFHELVFHGRAELTLLNFVFLSAIFTEQGFRWKELHGSLSDNVATNDARAVGEGSCNIGKHKDDQAKDKQSRHVDVCKVGGEVVMEWNILNTDESSTCSLSTKIWPIESGILCWNLKSSRASLSTSSDSFWTSVLKHSHGFSMTDYFRRAQLVPQTSVVSNREYQRSTVVEKSVSRSQKSEVTSGTANFDQL